ncbi:MAG: hypothetical protein ACAI38_18455 [Myxococcota bacterium]
MFSLRSALARVTDRRAAVRARAKLDALVASGQQEDVYSIVSWAQSVAALGRYREAHTINARAIELAEAGKLTKLARLCRSWQRELALHVARES